MPRDSSRNADLAFDVLTGGEWTALETEPNPERSQQKIGTTAWLEARKHVLADFIRSGEPIPDVFRSALADAIDGRNGPPVRILLRNARKYPLMATVMAEAHRARCALAALEAAQDRGLGYDDAKAAAAKAVGTNERDVGSLLSFARLSRDREQAIREALQGDKPMTEIHELINSPLPRPKPGRRPKLRKT